MFNNSFAEIESHTIQNVRVIWNVDNHWEMQAFVENLDDKEIIENLFPAATIGGTTYSWAPPRLWGVQVRYTM